MVGRRRAAGLALLACSAASAQTIDWTKYQDEAVRLLQEYIRIDTQNPPGNELRAAEFLHREFDRAKVPNTIYSFADGRSNIYARLKGDGRRRPLILLNHLDTVQADVAQWKAPPLSGEIRDGELWGRGALDMKGLAVLQMTAMLAAAREHVPLHRDLIFLGTADEEVADRGSQWMIRNHPELLRDAEFLLTEGGSAVTTAAGRGLYRIGFAEKAPLWIGLTATGAAGHGSVPIADSAPNRLVRAAFRVSEWQTPLRLLPAVEEYFHQIAQIEPEPMRGKLRRIEEAVKDPEFARELAARYPTYNVLLRNTVSLTVLEAGRQTNVIPAAASCRLDVRLLPGEDPRAFVAELAKVIADEQVKIEILEDFGPANSSPVDTPFFRMLQSTIETADRGAIVVAGLDSGYTESQMYRKLGIAAYGFNPIVTTVELNATKHGANERVPVEAYRRAVGVFFEAVRRAEE